MNLSELAAAPEPPTSLLFLPVVLESVLLLLVLSAALTISGGKLDCGSLVVGTSLALAGLSCSQVHHNLST
jgi:hypothetical protein